MKARSTLLGALTFAFVAGLAADVQAAFVITTIGTPGVDFQQSFARLQANNRQGSDLQVLDPLPFPFSGKISASYTSAGDYSSYAYLDATLSARESQFRVDASRADGGAKSGAGIDGQWLFSVTKTVVAVASGFLNGDADPVSGFYLFAALQDVTNGTTLFESNQESFQGAAGAQYGLGGLSGSYKNSFVGRLTNTLQPDHTYRFAYRLGAYNVVGDYRFVSNGQLSLDAVPSAAPEPETNVLMLAGLAMTVAVARRRKAPLHKHHH